VSETEAQIPQSHYQSSSLSGDPVEAVLASIPNRVEISLTGRPVEMPWLEKNQTPVRSFCGGNEVGDGVADALFGKVSPSGRPPSSSGRFWTSFVLHDHNAGRNRRLPKENPASLGFRIETANPGQIIHTCGLPLLQIV